MIEALIEKLKARLSKKQAKAQKAYINQNSSKITINCLNRGRALSDKTRVCKLGCIGENEAIAGQCWDEKASWCPEFELRQSVEALRAEFQGMSEEEIKLRWPSIGELLWMLRETEQLIQLGLEKVPGPDTKAG